MHKVPPSWDSFPAGAGRLCDFGSRGFDIQVTVPDTCVSDEKDYRRLLVNSRWFRYKRKNPRFTLPAHTLLLAYLREKDYN